MKKETLDVYERPEAEEVDMVVEFNYLQGSIEQPNPCEENTFCMEE